MRDPAISFWLGVVFGICLAGAFAVGVMTGAGASELRDVFARVEGSKAETCWGIPWESDTSRGQYAAVTQDRVPYVVNKLFIRCDSVRMCAPLECFYMGTLLTREDGTTAFYPAHRSAYPGNIHMLGAEPRP